MIGALSGRFEEPLLRVVSTGAAAVETLLSVQALPHISWILSAIVACEPTRPVILVTASDNSVKEVNS